MRDYFMISESDGGLYDTRGAQWSGLPPLRPNYSRHYPEIANVAQFKATLRAGSHTWPGFYSLALLTSDGAALCFDCGRKEFRLIADSIANAHNDGWRVVGCQMEHGESEMICDYCGATICEESN